ncbi:MAG: HlyD family efflux transporter periplasmic adaptor subunit [Armatimonadetes bacterium]|nr:HlyD family efflux transporter periplasmic adaptor subunit [Armatimonadota bacterium]
MKALRALAGGLIPLILVSLIVAVGAWILRTSVVRGREESSAAELAAIATARAEKGEFEVYVESVGKLAAVNSKSVLTEVSGQIIWVAPNGVELKEGDIVVELDAPRMFRQLREQEESYQQAVDDLEQKKRGLAAEIEKAELALDKAKRELAQFQLKKNLELANKRSTKEQDEAKLALSRERYERQQSLAEEGLVAEQDLELARTRIKAQEFSLERETKELALLEREKESEELDKKAAVTRAESELERVKSKKDAELRNAETALSIRKNQLERVQEDFQKSIILAPADGILVLEEQEQGGAQSRPLQPGDNVWQNRTVATIPDLSEMRVELELTQEDTRLVRVKQPAVVTVDSIPDVSFEAEVSEVSQTATESRIGGWIPSGERSFAVQVKIKDLKGERLRPGSTATARIVVDTLKEVVQVPLECVFEREGRQIVYVRKGEEFTPVEVKVGDRNKDAIVIREGLKGGEEVALRDVGKTNLDDEQTPAPETTTVAPPLPEGVTE